MTFSISTRSLIIVFFISSIRALAFGLFTKIADTPFSNSKECVKPSAPQQSPRVKSATLLVFVKGQVWQYGLKHQLEQNIRIYLLALNPFPFFSSILSARGSFHV